MGSKSERLGFAPPHPGEYLREDILPALGMTVQQFAEHIGVSRQSMSRLVNEKSDISTEMAVRLGQALKNGARFWLSLQVQRDIWEKEKEDKIHVLPIEWPNGHVA